MTITPARSSRSGHSRPPQLEHATEGLLNAGVRRNNGERERVLSISREEDDAKCDIGKGQARHWENLDYDNVDSHVKPTRNADEFTAFLKIYRRIENCVFHNQL
ncbi:hypothetical protein TRIUR3_25529 [Triticum urartu]|uniref:Uncharacterized protein n=1 Tax=Triticum urartu TaxID=4572 RepID=M7Z7Z7_TRIUA|nr:hypothetical protein TRIUR3_25529 [Triticum urartu]